MKNDLNIINNENEKFPIKIVKVVTDTILKELFCDWIFNPEQTTEFLQYIAQEITNELKPLISTKFDFFVQLSLSENVGQDFATGSMCLWDPNHDDYISTSYETSSFVCIASIYGCFK